MVTSPGGQASRRRRSKNPAPSLASGSSKSFGGERMDAEPTDAESVTSESVKKARRPQPPGRRRTEADGSGKLCKLLESNPLPTPTPGTKAGAGRAMTSRSRGGLGGMRGAVECDQGLEQAGKEG